MITTAPTPSADASLLIAAMIRAGYTQREREVALLLIGGMSAQAIADFLFISRRTVAAHASHAYAKSGIAPDGPVSRRTGVIRLIDALLKGVARGYPE